jgi:hypothetical protein
MRPLPLCSNWEWMKWRSSEAAMGEQRGWRSALSQQLFRDVCVCACASSGRGSNDCQWAGVHRRPQSGWVEQCGWVERSVGGTECGHRPTGVAQHAQYTMFWVHPGGHRAAVIVIGHDLTGYALWIPPRDFVQRVSCGDAGCVCGRLWRKPVRGGLVLVIHRVDHCVGQKQRFGHQLW